MRGPARGPGCCDRAAPKSASSPNAHPHAGPSAWPGRAPTAEFRVPPPTLPRAETLEQPRAAPLGSPESSAQEVFSRRARPVSKAWGGPSSGTRAPTLRDLTHNVYNGRLSLDVGTFSHLARRGHPKKRRLPHTVSGPPPGKLGTTLAQPWDLPGSDPAGWRPGQVSPTYPPPRTPSCPHPKIFQGLDLVHLLDFSPDSTGPTTTTT